MHIFNLNKKKGGNPTNYITRYFFSPPIIIHQINKLNEIISVVFFFFFGVVQISELTRGDM